MPNHTNALPATSDQYLSHLSLSVLWSSQLSYSANSLYRDHYFSPLSASVTKACTSICNSVFMVTENRVICRLSLTQLCIACSAYTILSATETSVHISPCFQFEWGNVTGSCRSTQTQSKVTFQDDIFFLSVHNFSSPSFSTKLQQHISLCWTRSNDYLNLLRYFLHGC